ncbi:MAG: HTH domain-containing protein [Chloroflexota bacterium]
MLLNFSKHVSIERSVHAVMVVFALASIGNVSAFFISTHHHGIVAFFMALALGAGVATSAIMLTKIDMVKQRRRYIAVGGVTLTMVFVSGFVQTQNYIAHGLTMGVSAAMGFGIVFAGECLTAIGLSLYQAAERRRKIDEADSGLELKLAETFADTLDAVDTTKSAAYIQRHLDRIVRHKADEMVAQYVPVAEPAPNPRGPQGDQIPTNAEPDAVMAAEMNPAKREASVQARRTNAESRRQVLLNMLSRDYDGSSVDELNKSELARQLGSSARTIQRDIEALREGGMLNGVVA